MAVADRPTEPPRTRSHLLTAATATTTAKEKPTDGEGEIDVSRVSAIGGSTAGL